MVDEKVVDQVWVTVVATGYGDQPLQRAKPQGDRQLNRVPADHEPRVTRAPRATEDFDVPEFVPRR
jgi:cell division protein FtsZ